MWHVSLEIMNSPIVLKLDITSVSSFACLELPPSRQARFGCDMQRLCARSTHSMFVFLPGASPGSPGKVDDVGKSHVEAEADKKLRLSCGGLSNLWSLFGSPKLGPVLGPVL